MPESSALLDAARLAAKQGSYDQAASICGAIIAADGMDSQAVADEASALLREIAEARRNPDRPLHVVLMGDSLAVPRPENAKTYDPRLAPALAPAFAGTYPALLRQTLAVAYSPRDIVLTTMCRSSNGMADVAADAYVGLFYFDPTVVVVHCGVVDLWPRDEHGQTGPRIDIDAFASALGRFLAVRREYCAAKPVVLVGVAPTDQRWIERLPGIDHTIETYNAVLAAASDERTAFIDMRRIVDPSQPERTLHLDGIHLNARGHAALATAIADAIGRLCPYGSLVPSVDRAVGGSSSNS